MVQAMIRLCTWLNEIDIQEFVQAEQKAMSIDILHETFETTQATNRSQQMACQIHTNENSVMHP